MNYELAKKLKDNGFPQQKCSMIWKSASVGMSTSDPVLMVPTLSELIEECPSWFEKENDYWFTLQKCKDFWSAGYLYYDNWHEKVGEGSTPEEAVAMLWLAINGKEI